MNHITQRYLEVGLPFTISAESRQAWEDWSAGRAAPLRLLPTNGDICRAQTRSPAGCGYPLLIDGRCPNQAGHFAGYCGAVVYAKYPGHGYNGVEGQCCLEPDHEGECEC